MFRKLLPLLSLSFVNVIGYSLLIPILPGILSRYVPSEENALYFGLLISSYSLFQFLFAPIWGGLSDKFGRKPILLISQIGTCFSWVIFGLAYFIDPSANIFGFNLALLILILARASDGITDGNVSVSNAWIADSTNSEQRARAYGYFGAIFGIGILAGPILGGLTTSTSIGF
jgi:MFS transporter, DHA1 family, tetracycline resistance protein